MRKSRKVDAIAIRNHMPEIMRLHGKLELISGIRANTWSGNGFECILNTPFTPLPYTPPRPASFAGSVALQKHKPTMPYQISIWRKGQGKVLSFEWDESGEHAVITFKRGSWEQELLALPPEELKPGTSLG